MPRIIIDDSPCWLLSKKSINLEHISAFEVLSPTPTVSVDEVVTIDGTPHNPNEKHRLVAIYTNRYQEIIYAGTESECVYLKDIIISHIISRSPAIQLATLITHMKEKVDSVTVAVIPKTATSTPQ